MHETKCKVCGSDSTGDWAHCQRCGANLERTKGTPMTPDEIERTWSELTSYEPLHGRKQGVFAVGRIHRRLMVIRHRGPLNSTIGRIVRLPKPDTKE